MSEINGINPNQISSIEPSSLEQTEKVADLKQTTAIAQDSIQLSTEAQNLQRIEQQILEIPEIDMTRVNTFKDRIEQGQYEVNANTLADKMMAFEENLFTSEN